MWGDATTLVSCAFSGSACSRRREERGCGYAIKASATCWWRSPRQARLTMGNVEGLRGLGEGANRGKWWNDVAKHPLNCKRLYAGAGKLIFPATMPFLRNPHMAASQAASDITFGGLRRATHILEAPKRWTCMCLVPRVDR